MLKALFVSRAFSLTGMLKGEPAAAKNFIGKSSVKQRVGLAGAYFGTSFIANKIIGHHAEQERAYYGDARYDSYYGQASESLQGLIGAAGMVLGGLALIDRDPISRIRNSYRYRFGRERQLYNRLGKRGTRLESEQARSSFDSATGTRLQSTEAFTNQSRMGVVQKKLQSIGKAPRMGPLSLIIAAGVLGQSTIGTILNTPYVGVGAAALGGAVVGGVGVKMLAGIGGGSGMVAATAAGGAAGWALGSRFNNPTAEGNIIDFRDYNEQGVSRMNFATTGLVQALHKNNRKY